VGCRVRVLKLSAVAVNGVFDHVALLAVEIHDECLDGQIVGLRSARPAANVDRALDLLLRRNLEHSVADRQCFRRVRCHQFTVYEADVAAGIVKVSLQARRRPTTADLGLASRACR
jgi:hypothetical protein